MGFIDGLFNASVDFLSSRACDATSAVAGAKETIALRSAGIVLQSAPDDQKQKALTPLILLSHLKGGGLPDSVSKAVTDASKVQVSSAVADASMRRTIFPGAGRGATAGRRGEQTVGLRRPANVRVGKSAWQGRAQDLCPLARLAIGSGLAGGRGA